MGSFPSDCNFQGGWCKKLLRFVNGTKKEKNIDKYFLRLFLYTAKEGIKA
jgi:hypothetical protein